jgi:hypothetical protein
MKSTPEIRRYNLSILIDEAGGRTAFTNKTKAIELKIEYGYIGQLVNNSRGIGNSVARKLELIGNKPINWLDHPHYKKWLELEFISEEEMPNNEILKDNSFLSQVQEPKDFNYDLNIHLDKTSTIHKNEIEQLIKKITFIYSQDNNEEDLEIIKRIVDMVFKKNQ